LNVVTLKWPALPSAVNLPAALSAAIVWPVCSASATVLDATLESNARMYLVDMPYRRKFAQKKHILAMAAPSAIMIRPKRMSLTAS
jgi:hypothetical protein